MATRIVATLLILGALSACGCERDAEKPDTTFRLEIASVELFDVIGDSTFDTYRVTVHIHGESAVQELSMWRPYGTDTLVECFQIPRGGRMNDVHTDGSLREMLLYPARVSGADVDEHGFAHVPANIDGSFVTTPAAHVSMAGGGPELRGVVTKADMSRAIRWRIEPMADRPGTPGVDPCLLIVIDGFEHWYHQ